MVVGGIGLVLLIVIGALAGTRRPTVPVAANPTTSPTLSPSPSPPAPSPTSAAPTASVVVAQTPAPSAAPTGAAAPTSEPTEPPTAVPTATPTSEPTPDEQFVEFFDGTWEIGVDIPAGTYRTLDYTDGCYWARLKGFSGDLDDIIANEFGSGYQVVTIAARDAGFESDDCGDWTSDLSQVTESDTAFDEGTYIVGTDIRPGTYQADASDGCYWARLKGFRGTLNEIIANDFRDGGRAIVRIRPADAGFTTNGCGSWTLR